MSALGGDGSKHHIRNSNRDCDMVAAWTLRLVIGPVYIVLEIRDVKLRR